MAFCRPIARVVQQHPELDRDVSRIDPDIRLGAAKRPAPFPDIAEQAPVQLPHELLARRIGLAATAEPDQATFNVDLLQLVKLAACRNVPEPEAIQTRVQGRAAWRLSGSGRGGSHPSAQNSAGIARARSAAILATSALFFSSGSD